MLNKIKSLLASRPERPLPAVPSGERIYAVGDIHGRLDLVTAIAAAIETDDADRGPADTTIILLGDLVDRGPDSAGVLKEVRDWASRRKVRIIMGNHEEMLLDSLTCPDTFRLFAKYGGRETVLSYGIDAINYASVEPERLHQMFVSAVPLDDVAMLRGFEDMIAKGDYLFVHAGILPGVAIDEQRTSNLRWIREPFLGYQGDHGSVIVHGHTIVNTAELRSNRIGIDTGAFRSGCLTALGLEGTERWVIETCDDGGTITATTRSAE